MGGGSPEEPALRAALLRRHAHRPDHRPLRISARETVASVTTVRLVQDAGDRRPQIEAALALGASPRQCTADIMRRSVRLAMVPVIDSTKTMGIVFLPGAMTGMILAGAEPLQAVRLQVVVVFVLLAAVSLTETIVSLLAPGRLFTAQMQLRRLGA